KYNTRNIQRYGLYAIIFHSGASTDVGHYYCFCRQSDDPFLDEDDSDVSPWYCFNDHDVSRKSFRDMQKVSEKSPRDCPYILFYRRLDGLKEDRQAASLNVRTRRKVSAHIPPR